jgi:hypothetical protein
MENYQVQFRDLLKRAVSEPGTISAAYSAFQVIWRSPKHRARVGQARATDTRPQAAHADPRS